MPSKKTEGKIISYTNRVLSPAMREKYDIPKLNITVELIGTEKAEEYLGHVGTQRRINQRYLNTYAKDMTKGQWRFSSEPIKFDSNGALIDGQHRLRAVIASHTAQPFMICRGENPLNFDILDQGLQRSVAQILQMQGENNYVVLAAAARLMYLWEQEGFSRQFKERVTPGDVAQMIAEHPGLRMAAETFGGSSRLTQLSFKSVNVFVYHLFHSIDEERAYLFMCEVEEGGRPGTVTKLLFDRLMSDRLKGRINTQRDLIGMWIKCWNEYVAPGSKPMRQLRWVKGDPMPALQEPGQ